MSALSQFRGRRGVRVGKVAEVRLGKMLQPEPRGEADRLVPYLRAGLIGGPGDAELPAMYASPFEVSVYAVRHGDLLVAEGGDIGRVEEVGSVPSETIIQNSLHRLRLQVGDRRFLRYALQHIYDSGWLDVLCNRATFGHLTREKLCSLRIPWPRVEEQRRIADFLDHETARIDALIDLRQMQVELSGERLRSALALQLFAWPTDTWGPLSRVIDLLPGYAFASDDFSTQATGRVPLLRGINVAPGRVRWDECVYLSGEAPAPLTRRYGLQEGDLVLGMDRPFIGSGTRLAQISKSDLPCLLVQRVARIRPRAAITSEYLRLLLQSEAFEAHCAPVVTGVSVPHISPDQIGSFRVPLPSASAQLDRVGPLVEAEQQFGQLRACAQRQIDLLRERRQALITHAVTGRLPIPA